MAQRSPHPGDDLTPGGDEGTVQRRLMPIRVSQKAVAVHRAELPAPVRKAAKAVVVGAALQIGASLAMRYLAINTGKHAGGAVAAKGLQAATRKKPARTDARAEMTPAVPDDAEVISETLLIRRVWIRRRS